MQKLRILFHILLLGCFAIAEPVAEAASGDLAARVGQLVRRLDAPQLQERNAAEEELVRLGPGVLPLLPPDGAPSRPEVDLRLGRVRLKLQQAQAGASLLASRVTLHVRDMPLSKVLAAIQEQTGNKIVDGRRRAADQASDPRLSVDFDKTPFWQALDEVLDRSGLTVYPFGDDHSAVIVAAGGGAASRAGRASYSGPFRFETVRVVAQRDLRTPDGGVLQLEMEVAWEPRLRPIALQYRLADVKAVDDRGKPLAVRSLQAQPEVPIEPGPIAKVLTLPLALPPREAGKIAQLQGTLHALVPGKAETFRFADLAKAQNVEKRIAGATVVLEQVRKRDKGWEVQIRVRFDRTHGALASHRNWMLNNPAYLERSDGKRVPPAPLPETTQRDPVEIGVGYLFAVDGPLDGLTFVYQTPTGIFAVPVEYQLRDIPLP